MISPTQYLEWHPGHAPALMQAHIRAPALSGLTGCLLRHSLTFHSTSIPADNSAWLSIVRLYCVIEVQGQAYKSRTPPRLWPLFPKANTTIKKIWGGWLPPVTKLTSHSNQTAGEWWRMEGSAVQSQGEASFSSTTPSVCLTSSPARSIPLGTNPLYSLRASFRPHVTCGELQLPSKPSIWTWQEVHFPVGLCSKCISHQELKQMLFTAKLQRAFTNNQGWKHIHPKCLWL